MIFLPPSQHQLYQNFASLTDPALGFVYESQARTFGNAGETLPLLQFESHGQLTVFFSYQSFQQIGGDAKFALQSSNGSGGLAYEMPFSEAFRVSLGFAHTGGHYSEGTPYNPLFNVSALYDRFIAKSVFDLDRMLRFTLSFEPLTRSSPDLQWLMSEQSIMLFPLDPDRFHPYFAVGVREGGVSGSQTSYGFDAQLGVDSGNPFSENHTQQIRAAIGYYTGPDLSVKNFLYLNSSVNFVYLGIFVNF